MSIDTEASRHRLLCPRWILLLQALRDGTPLRQSLEGVEARQIIVAPANVVAQEIVAGAKPIQLCPPESDERLERSNCGAHLRSEKDGTGFESSENA